MASFTEGSRGDVGPKAPHRPGRLERLVATGAAGMLASQMAEASEPSNVHLTGEADQTHIEAHAEVETGGEARKFDFGGYLPVIDSQGNFSWSRLMEPAYATVGIEKSGTSEKKLEVVVPALWARYFDTADWKDPETRDKILASVSAEVRDALMQDLHGLNWDKDDYLDRNGIVKDGWKVTNALVVGEASPEAETISSVIPGNIDEKNIKLAEEVRGQEGAAILVEALQNLGIQVDESLVSVQGDEIQFAPDEYQELQDLATEAGKKGNAAKQIWELIADYNKDKIDDPLLQADLDRLVGDKRMVRIQLTLEHGNKDTYLIPLPLLALALLKIRFPDPVKPEAPSPEGPIGPSRKPILDTIPPNEREKDPQDFVNEIGIDLERSLDFYVPLVMEAKKDLHPDDNTLSHMILDAWTENDNGLNQRSGRPIEDHQSNRPRQVLYANLHARALHRLFDEADIRGIDMQTAWNKREVRQMVANEVEKEVKRLQELPQ